MGANARLGYLVRDKLDHMRQTLSISTIAHRGRRMLLQLLKRGSSKPGSAAVATQQAQRLWVEMVTIDEVVSEHVDFMKVDVLGREYNVLRGAAATMSSHRIDVIYLEYSGDSRVTDWLADCGYTCFDTDYLIVPAAEDVDRWRDLRFYDAQRIDLSTGAPAWKAKLAAPTSDYEALFRSFRSRGSYLQTDLICVHDRFLDQFIVNLARYIEQCGDQ